LNQFPIHTGTLCPICRPKENQRECYSGHKRSHGLKYQAVVLPNGIITNLYGPVPGRRHDAYMFAESRIHEEWAAKYQNGPNPGAEYYLYGDTAYPLRNHLITPFQSSANRADQRSFNEAMSKVRVCVEWEFGRIVGDFAFVDFKKNQKLYLQPVAKQFFVATLLKNCRNCVYGGETSTYFGLTPPTLEAYLNNDINLQ